MIIASGIIMTIFDKTDIGSYSTKGGGTYEFALTGPGVIILGIIVLVVLLFFRKVDIPVK